MWFGSGDCGHGFNSYSSGHFSQILVEHLSIVKHSSDCLLLRLAVFRIYTRGTGWLLVFPMFLLEFINRYDNILINDVYVCLLKLYICYV